MRAANIVHLGGKELRSLARDPMMLVLIAYAFTVAIYTAATAQPETLSKASIAIVDEDRSPLSQRIADAFFPPYFLPPVRIGQAEMDARMDAGLSTFALDIPPEFQRDVLAGRAPEIQLNVDATRMSQALTGSAYIQTIVAAEVNAFIKRYRAATTLPVNLVDRVRFNPELNRSWFGAIMQVINQVTMLSIVLTGAALIREREHGTIEHLLVMPVTPFEIMTSKVWSMALSPAAAIDHQFRAGDKRGLVRAQEQRAIGDFLRLAETRQRRLAVNAFDQRLHVGAAAGKGFGQDRRFDNARMHRIDADALGGVFQRRRLGHQPHRALGGVIGQHVRAANNSVY